MTEQKRFPKIEKYVEIYRLNQLLEESPEGEIPPELTADGALRMHNLLWEILEATEEGFLVMSPELEQEFSNLLDLYVLFVNHVGGIEPLIVAEKTPEEAMAGFLMIFGFNKDR